LKTLELKLPPAAVLLICIGMAWGIDSLLPPILDIRASGWVVKTLLAIGVLTGAAGVIQFAVQSTSVNPHKPDHASSLVTSGIYRFSRNPMYLGMLIILLAAVLKLGHPLGLLVLPLYIIYMNRFQILPEERVMLEKFGEEFTSYCRKVRRWI